MRKDELQRFLEANHARFLEALQNHAGEPDRPVAPGKWSPAQQADHLYRSIRPVNLAFGLPAFLLRWMFGRANRPSRTYDELVARYKQKLAEGGRAPAAFVPRPEPLDTSVSRIHRVTRQLIGRVNQCTENNLDHLILPHPLLGKLTLREMLYFTAYHAEHHRLQLS